MGEPDRLFAHSMPAADESMPGYLLRLGELNYISGMVMIQLMGSGWLTSRRSQAETERVANMLQVPVEVWANHEQFPFGQDLLERREFTSIDKRFWSRSASWVCPQCFAEAKYQRTAWHISLHPICSKHGIYLVGKCPACGKNLKSFRRRWLTRCNCGFELIGAPVSSVGSNEIKLSALIDRRLGDPAASPTEHPLGGLPLGLLLRLVRFLGMERPAKSVRMRKKCEDYVREFTLSALALSDWPHSFHHALNRLFASEGNWESLAFKSYAARFLGNSFPGQAGAIVRKQMRLWLAQSYPFDLTDFAGSTSSKITHVSALLRRDGSQMLRRAKELNLIERQEESKRRVATTIRFESLSELMDDLERRSKPEGFLRPYEAMRMLGVSTFGPLVELCRDGLVEFRLHENYAFFSHDSLMTLLRSLNPRRKPIRRDGQYMRVQYRSFCCGLVISRLIEEIGHSKLELYTSSEKELPSLADILIRRTDYMRLNAAGDGKNGRGSLVTPAIKHVNQAVEFLKLSNDADGEELLPPMIWHSRYTSESFGIHSQP